MAHEFKLEGAKEVRQMMIELGPDVAQAAGRSGLFAASKHMMRAITRASPEVTGTLKKEWQVKRLPQNRKGDAVAYAVRLRDRYYYELLEFIGVKPGSRSKAGHASRQSAPQRRGRYHPFAESAMMRAKGKAFTLIVESTKRELIKAAAKINKASKTGN